MLADQVINGVLSNPVFAYQPINNFLCLQNIRMFEGHVMDGLLNNPVFGYQLINGTIH